MLVCLTDCGDSGVTAPPTETSGGTTTAGATVSSSGGDDLPGLLDLAHADGDCFSEVWAWRGQDAWRTPEHALARSGSRFVTVGGRDPDVLVLALEGDGALAWGSTAVEHSAAYYTLWSSILGLPGNDLLTVIFDGEGTWVERWSPAGVSAGSVQVPVAGHQFGPTALTPGGDVLLGGFAGANDELDGTAVLVSMTPDGAVGWERTLDHSVVSALGVDVDGTIFLLVVDRAFEGGDTYLEARAPDGELRWSVLAGSDTGFTFVPPLSPFALTPDGEGGVITVGHRFDFDAEEDVVYLARHDVTGGKTWQTAVRSPDAVGGGGGGSVLRTADAVVWAVGSNTSTRLGVLDPGGALLCDSVISGRPAESILVASSDEVVVVGHDIIDSALWVARYRAPAGLL